MYGQQKTLRTNLPQMALVAELEFIEADADHHPVGPASYRPCYISLPERATNNQLYELDDEHIPPVVEGLLSEPLNKRLSQSQIGQFQALMLRLQEYAQQQLEYRRNTLRRTQRRLRHSGTLTGEENLAKAQTVEVRLVNLKCLVL